MKQFWIARWVTLNGTPKEFVFDSVEDYIIARVDFQLKCMERGLQCPNEFDLEEFRNRGEFRFPLTTPLKQVFPGGIA